MVDSFLAARGSTLARRLQVLLLAVAPLPLVLLLLISTRQYESKLRSETERRLSARAKDSGLELYRRLTDLETDLRWASQEVGQQPGIALYLHPWRDRFHRLIRLEGGQQPPGTTVVEGGTRSGWQQRLPAGQAALLEARSANGQPALWLAVPAEDGAGRVLWGEVRLDWLWATGVLPVEGDQRWLLLGSRGQHLLAAAPVPAPELVERLRPIVGQGVGGVDWRGPAGHLWRARFATIPLGHEFGHPGLVAVASEQDRLGDEAASLRRTSWLVALGALLVLVLVVGRRLRSDLEPISALLRGTESLARGDLSTRVQVRGAKDLEQLGQGFNVMATELERSFHLLQAGNDVAVSALASAPAAEQVATAFVARVCSIAPPPIEPVVILFDGHDRNVVVRGKPGGAGALESWQLPASVREVSGWVTLEGGRSLWRAIRHGERVFGAVGLLGCDASGPDRGFLAALDGPGSQLDLAMSRVHLIADLDRANWGTLTALARAVDSASPWTRGHSERVTEISLAIGEELGLDSAQLRTIRRGGLLHDVGKIGVPATILDSPNRLTREEIVIVQSHVEKGVRILEPVEGLQDVMPIVWQHHERLDGSGYPRGLKGAEIDPLGLLVAVADVFEATSASRPYRPAIDPEVCFAYLLARSGSQFDPSCVEALGRARRKPSWPYPELAAGAATTARASVPATGGLAGFPGTLSEPAPAPRRGATR